MIHLQYLYSSEISGAIPYSTEEIVNYTNDVEEESSGPQSVPAINKQQQVKIR